MDCPYCGEWNLEGTRECECGYLFEGYEEVVEAEETEIRARSRTRQMVGWGLIATGVLLSVGSFFLSSSFGGTRFLAFTGVILAGVAMLFMPARR